MFKLLAFSMPVLLATPSASANENMVRVAVEKNARIVTVSSTTALSASCDAEDDLHFVDGARLLTAQPARGGMMINGHATACQTVVVKSDGVIRFGAKEYPGSLVFARNAAGISVVNHVDMEDYVAGVIMAEMGPNWPLEALKAQAVASRTFARYQMERTGGQPYDLDNTVRSQVYAGAAGAWMERVKEAVESTKGIIAVYEGAPAGTFYHSSAGGRTESPGDVWGRRTVPYLTSQPALFEEGSPHHRWRLRMSHKEISDQLKKAGIGAGQVVSIETVSHTSSGRVGRLRLVCGPNKKKVEMRGEYFRKIIGDRRLPSTKFNVSKDSRGFTFTGQGYGHGVGMSQWSARGLAERGRGYEEIIQAFYPGVTLEPSFKEPLRMEEQAPSSQPSIEPEKEATVASNEAQTGESRIPEPIAD